MTESFVKRRSGPGAQQFLATEAAGLAWIRVPGGPRVPELLALGPGRIELARVTQGRPTAAAGRLFGARLARLHAAGAQRFGAAPPGAPGPDGWIGDLPMEYAAHDDWPTFWARSRLLPTARRARARGGLDTAGTEEVERFCADLLAGAIDTGPAEPPARLHGDLWSGNVLWDPEGQVWLIDPAAHGGHRESDLAMLALFGLPHLEAVIAGYDEVSPLAEGWHRRVPLHQAWPLLVHAALFGGGYGASALAALRRARG